MKKITSLIILLFTTIIGMSITSEASISHPTEKEKDNPQEMHEFNVNEAQLYFESEVYDVNSVIDLSIILDLSNEILDYDLDCNGFEVVNDVLISKDIITFSVKYIADEKNPSLEFSLNLIDNVDLSLSLFGYIRDNKLFLNRSSFKEAEEVYLYYLQQNDTEAYERIRSEEMICDDPIKPSSIMKLPSASLLASNPDTYVQGTFSWVDDDGISHPLQFNRVELWDKEPIGETLMAYTYTNENGFYRFEFNNADNFIEFENGGYDVFVRVLPMGENTRVYRGNGSSYQVDLGFYENIPTGTVHYVSNEFKMKEDSFAQALQVSQAAIFASKYVKEMNNGKNIASVSIRYPHDESSTGCFYRRSNKTLYIRKPETSQSLKSYASWDVIMHEYGHHVQYEFDISNSPAGTHWIGERMGDHYKSHYDGVDGANCGCSWRNFSESECKLQGNRLAWGEGWPTFLGTVAQQYFSANLSNIRTVGDSSYTSYNGVNYSLTNAHRRGDDCEVTVQSILYEMYDNSSDDAARDSLALGHKVMWDMTTGSKAKTFQEFDTYFRSNCTDKYNLKYYGRILGYYNLAPSIPTVSKGSLVSPTFTWSWAPSSPSTYFNNTFYELNFYDYDYNLIGRSSRTTSTSLSPSNSLWTEVLNSGNMFYVSVTRYENNSPESCYEGEQYLYLIPSAILMSVSSNYTKTLGTGDCYWFVFRAPQNTTYDFETTGSTDTFGELFSQIVLDRSTDNQIDANDDGGEGNNFKLSYSMNKGDVVYLRVRGYNWDRIGEFTLSVSAPNHTHDYTYSYVSKNDTYHIAKCFCGDSKQESHDYYIDKLGRRCNNCGHFTKGLTPVPITPSQICDIDSIMKKEEDY